MLRENAEESQFFAFEMSDRDRDDERFCCHCLNSMAKHIYSMLHLATKLGISLDMETYLENHVLKDCRYFDKLPAIK